MSPVDMYLIQNAIVLFNNRLYGRKWSYDECDKISLLLHKGPDCHIHEMIRSGLSYHLIDVLLAFKGVLIDTETTKPDRDTGLYSFMIAATSSVRSLDFVYKMAIIDPTVIQQYGHMRCGSKRGREDNT